MGYSKSGFMVTKLQSPSRVDVRFDLVRDSETAPTKCVALRDNLQICWGAPDSRTQDLELVLRL
jgi:hypothetical protein